MHTAQVPRWKFGALNGYVRNKKDSQMNGPCFYLMKLVEEEQIKPKASGKKEIIKPWAEINKIENTRKNQTGSWFFEKVNKIYKPLARLTREKKDTIYQY